MVEIQNYNPPRYSIRGNGTIIGRSSAMLSLFEYLNRLADLPTTVLLTGETGTGKELCAKALHYNNKPSNGNGLHRPFVAVNCAGIPVELLESELFGHVKGSFTGAYADKKGLVEVADGGTLFLDEIAEMHPALQAKLLRMLQEHEIHPVGSTRPKRVSARVIAATNKDLGQEIEKGRFREDLFYRLNVFPLKVPPLRERDDDAALIANYFVERNNERYQAGVKGLSDSAREKLLAHPWKGNVRELENIVERAFVIRMDGEIDAEDIVFDCSKMPRIRAHDNEASVEVVEASPQPDESTAVQQGSSLWYERGVVPVASSELAKLKDAKCYGAIRDYARDWEICSPYLGPKKPRILFVTPENATLIFHVLGDDYRTLVNTARNGSFNAVVREPFCVYNVGSLATQLSKPALERAITLIGRDAFIVPYHSSDTFFIMTVPLAEKIFENESVLLPAVIEKIRSEYATFQKWKPRGGFKARPKPRKGTICLAPLTEVEQVKPPAPSLPTPIAPAA